MNDNLEKAKSLLAKYSQGSCTEEEQAWIENWYLNLNVQEPDLPKDLMLADLNELHSRIGQTVKPKTNWKIYGAIAAAASILAVVGAGVIFYISERPLPVNRLALAIEDIAPGSNKAILILSDGRRINLNDAANGQLAMQSGARISKAADGQLVYTVTETNRTDNASINTIKTPRGGQYRLQLPDGTKVWLNAASSLEYPATFHGRTERRVELSGEAYFEVSPNSKQPFIVQSMTQEIKVLGTHFNVNSYADETVNITTLLEGKVRVGSKANPNETSVLKPGQQAVSNAAGIQVGEADVEAVVAWKNGLLQFKDANIASIMRQVSRWYDLDVSYQGAIPKNLYTGGIERRAQLSNLLKIFEASGIKFRIEEKANRKTLIVSP